MRWWFVADVCGTGRDRGEAGEYHHCDSLRRSSRGGSSGGSLDTQDLLGSGSGFSDQSRVPGGTGPPGRGRTISSGPLRWIRKPSQRCHGR